MQRPSRSLFWSLTGSIVAVLFLTALLQVLLAIFVVEPIIQRRLASQAEELVEAVAPEVVATLTDGGPAALPPTLMRYQRLNDEVLLVFEPAGGGRILPRPPGRWSRGGARNEGSRPRMREGFPPPDETPIVLASRTIEIDGEVAGELLGLRRGGRRLALTAWLPVRWLLLFPASLVAAALGGMWIFRRLRNRIVALEAQAEAVGEGDLSTRIARPGDDELGRLAQRLNTMTDNLAAARTRLESMERERKRMLADITHELSTPLTSVRGYAETLLDGRVVVDEEQRDRYLRDILHASERMGLLIDDLLDLARLEAGGGHLDPQALDLADLARNSVRRHEPAFGRAGLAVVFQGEGTPAMVHADGLRLEQVVDNLLANAMRHVPAGGRVVVRVRVEPSVAVLEVEDDGPGFDEEAIEHVFERFYRADSSRTAPGSGLGLAIVREIVLKHGGSVEAANADPGGARLTVRLPLAG